MPTVYTPDPTTFHPDVTVPSDGDAETAESVNAALRALADDVAEVRSHVDGSAVDTTIGASGLDSLTVKAAATFEQPVELTGGASLDVSGTVTVADTLTTNGDFEANGLAEFHGNTIIGDDGGDALTVEATQTNNAPATFNANVTTNADTDLGSSSSDQVRVHGATTLNASAQVKDRLFFSSNGHIVERYVIMPVGDLTFSPVSDGCAVYNGTGVLGASQKIIIDDTDAEDGDWFEVTNMDPTWAITVRSPGDLANVGSALSHAASGSTIYAAKYRRMGGSWFQVWTTRGAP